MRIRNKSGRFDKNPTYRRCKNCGNDFIAKRSSSIFCNKMCSGQGERNENNYSWKDDQAGYSAIHKWINSRLGRPKKCSYCGTIKAKRYEWANISGRYNRFDFDDWIRLCSSCHIKLDRYKSISIK